MSIPSRIEFARALRYQRRHFNDHPYATSYNKRERNVLCVLYAVKRYVTDKNQIKSFLEAIDYSKTNISI